MDNRRAGSPTRAVDKRRTALVTLGRARARAPSAPAPSPPRARAPGRATCQHRREGRAGRAPPPAKRAPTATPNPADPEPRRLHVRLGDLERGERVVDLVAAHHGRRAARLW